MKRAFTVIELLIVIGIMTILTTFLVMGMRGAGSKAQEKATVALIEKIKVALDNYYGHFRDYPPDGYDDEQNGWGPPEAAAPYGGINLGVPPHRMKGTSTLLYFLCRPVVKITYSGSPSDPRNIIMQAVGPFLQLDPGNYSREGFNPAHPWADNNYWETQQYRLTEIVDPFYRPMHYDKVKAYPAAGNPFKYFQPTRFNWLHTSATATNNGKGRFVHSDQQFLNDKVLPLDDNEKQCPTDVGGGKTHEYGLESLSEQQKLGIHPDPRYKKGALAQADGCAVSTYSPPDGSAFPSTDLAGAALLEPKYVGGFNVWSHGMSYTSPRDDIVSWGE